MSDKIKLYILKTVNDLDIITHLLHKVAVLII